MHRSWILILLPILGCSRAPEQPAPAQTPAHAPPPAQESTRESFIHDGQDFRAQGQEPGWFLGIDHEGSLLLVYDYMERRITMPAPGPVVDREGTITYTADPRSPRLIVTARSRECHDSMSGQPFPLTVTVKVEQRELTGCGRNLEPADSPRTEMPPLPFEDIGACPFEGCVYREWTVTRPVSVLTDRRDAAPVAFELAAGARVRAITGVVIVLSPGIVEFTTETDVQATDGPIRMRPGERMYLLTSLGEGFVKAWIHGRLHTDVDASRLRADRIASSVWWVQVRDASGRIGWTRQTDAFDGKDARA
jgi:uncharacterized membrane protein